MFTLRLFTQSSYAKSTYCGRLRTDAYLRRGPKATPPYPQIPISAPNSGTFRVSACLRHLCAERAKGCVFAGRNGGRRWLRMHLEQRGTATNPPDQYTQHTRKVEWHTLAGDARPPSPFRTHRRVCFFLCHVPTCTSTSTSVSGGRAA
jgi:hypothetical protein